MLNTFSSTPNVDVTGELGVHESKDKVPALAMIIFAFTILIVKKKIINDLIIYFLLFWILNSRISPNIKLFI